MSRLGMKTYIGHQQKIVKHLNPFGLCPGVFCHAAALTMRSRQLNDNLVVERIVWSNRMNDKYY